VKAQPLVPSQHFGFVGVLSPALLWFCFPKWAPGIGKRVKEKFYLLVLILKRREFPICEPLLSRNQ
jgi:hypothetical protein